MQSHLVLNAKISARSLFVDPIDNSKKFVCSLDCLKKYFISEFGTLGNWKGRHKEEEQKKKKLKKGEKKKK